MNLCKAIECPRFEETGCSHYTISNLCHLLYDSEDGNKFYLRKIIVENVPVEISVNRYFLYANCDQKIIDALKVKNESFLLSDPSYLEYIEFMKIYELKMFSKLDELPKNVNELYAAFDNTIQTEIDEIHDKIDEQESLNPVNSLDILAQESKKISESLHLIYIENALTNQRLSDKDKKKCSKKDITKVQNDIEDLTSAMQDFVSQFDVMAKILLNLEKKFNEIDRNIELLAKGMVKINSNDENI